MSPKIIHSPKSEDAKVLERIVQTFAQGIVTAGRERQDQMKGWRDPKNLLKLRKRLFDSVKEATVERNDSVGASVKKGEIVRRDIYEEIAMLAMCCAYHNSEQLKNIEEAFLSV